MFGTEEGVERAADELRRCACVSRCLAPGNMYTLPSAKQRHVPLGPGGRERDGKNFTHDDNDT